MRIIVLILLIINICYFGYNMLVREQIIEPISWLGGMPDLDER